jgi:hypothetical protein
VPAADGCEDVSAPLDADAAALLADIAAFDIDAARQRVQEIDARHTGLRRSNTVFPQAEADPGLPRVPTPVDVPPAARPVSPVEPQKSGPGGLLGQLRAEVASRQQHVSELTREQGAVRAVFDRRLRQVFDYLHELSKQLNYLKPAINRAYFFLDANDAFRNLTWQEGFTDLRTLSQTEGGGIERVTFSYTLRGPGERVLERPGPGVERLRKMLFDLGLRFECKEIRNRQRELERAVFTVADEILVQMVWRADPDKGAVVLESRNLERLGHAVVSLRPEAIDQGVLDEFGLLLLGRENRFRAHLMR